MPTEGTQAYLQMNGLIHDNIQKVETEIPPNSRDYIQDIARPITPLDPQKYNEEFMQCQRSNCELVLEDLDLVDHGKAFKRRRIGFYSALTDNRPLPKDTPLEGGIQ